MGTPPPTPSSGMPESRVLSWLSPAEGARECQSKGRVNKGPGVHAGTKPGRLARECRFTLPMLQDTDLPSPPCLPGLLFRGGFTFEKVAQGACLSMLGLGRTDTDSQISKLCCEGDIQAESFPTAACGLPGRGECRVPAGNAMPSLLPHLI